LTLSEHIISPNKNNMYDIKNILYTNTKCQVASLVIELDINKRIETKQ